jgi:hypothetical protein
MDVIDEVVSALCEGDLERFVACYAADAWIEDSAGTPLAVGRESIRLRYEEMLRQFPRLRVRKIGRLTVGAFVAQEEEILGRSRQPERHIAIYQLVDGLIARERLLR